MELTKAEEQILHYLWKLEEATVQDILSCMERRINRVEYANGLTKLFMVPYNQYRVSVSL